MRIDGLIGLTCLARGHAPKKSLAQWHGDDVLAPCRRCGRQMIRRDRGWELLQAGSSRRGMPSPARLGVAIAVLVAMAAVAALLGYLAAPKEVRLQPHHGHEASTAPPTIAAAD